MKNSVRVQQGPSSGLGEGSDWERESCSLNEDLKNLS